MNPKPTRCLHWGHHLLRQCQQLAEFDGLCGDHFLSCGVGCPPVRFIWWTRLAGPGFWLRVGKSKDEYGNTSRYLQVPLLGTLVVFGGFRTLSHERVPDYPVSTDGQT